MSANEVKRMAEELWGERVRSAARNVKASLLGPRLQRCCFTIKTKGL